MNESKELSQRPTKPGLTPRYMESSAQQSPLDPPAICAIIVTYFPPDDLVDVVEAARDQVKHILIVDNGSQPNRKRVALLDSLEGSGVTIVRSRENLGVATALNMGLNWAKERGFNWILTLDQDTICDRNMVATMIKAYREDLNRDRIGVMAPIHYDRDTQHVSKEIRNLEEPLSERGIVMTSGNLIPMHVFEKIGPYNDDLFIEYVDTDFCLKLREVDLRVTLVRDARMGHRLGEMRRHKFLWRTFFSHNYQPVRRYYRARNRIILYRHYKKGYWMLSDQNFAIRDFIKILFVEDQKWAKIKAMFLGTVDAFLGRVGRAEGATYLTPKAPRYYVEMRKEIVPLLPQFSERALDLGCGSGITSGQLKSQGRFGWVCGVEGNPEAAAEAEKVLDKVLLGDIEKMEYLFPEGYFDTILALDILEHLVDPWKILAILHRLLKPGGRLIVSIPNVRHYSVVVPLVLFGDFRYQQEYILDSTHIRFFTKRTIIRTLVDAGFEIEMTDYTGAKWGLGGKANKLTLGLLKEFFIFQNLIACKKKV